MVTQKPRIKLTNGDYRTEANIQGAPDLMVQTLSPSTVERDRGYKRTLYARHGVREYRVAGPNSATVTVLVLGDAVSSPVVEGFRVRIDEVFSM